VLHCEQVDEALMGFIIGKGASTKKQIEADTGAELCIPRRDEARSHNPVGMVEFKTLNQIFI
jgi:hypothetical protein